MDITLTIPDISFMVNKVCHYMYILRVSHWLVVKKILRYLQGVLSNGMVLNHPLCYPCKDLLMQIGHHVRTINGIDYVLLFIWVSILLCGLL